MRPLIHVGVPQAILHECDIRAGVQQMHTDLTEFYPACQQWHRRLLGVPLPLAAFQVPAPLLVPGCTVQLDLWVYVP